jgi:hypothetical protein
MQIEPSLRASDDDREKLAERLRHAATEGRLSVDELGQRLDAVYAARTMAELDKLVSDLPVSRAHERRGVPIRGLVGGLSALTLMIAMLGVLVSVRARSASAIVAPGHFRRLTLPIPAPDPYHWLVVPLSLVVVCAAAVTCAALLWGSTRTRSPHRQP